MEGAPAWALADFFLSKGTGTGEVTEQALGLVLRPHLLSQRRNRYFRIGPSDRVIPAKGETSGGGDRKLIIKANFSSKIINLFLFFSKQNQWPHYAQGPTDILLVSSKSG